MAEIYFDKSKKGNEISPLLYGVFFEDINYGGDGGLYGELISNRSFEYYDHDGKKDMRKLGWEAFGEDSFEICSDVPINDVHINYAVIEGKGGIRNLGYCSLGFGVKKGEKLELSLYAMGKASLTARIADKLGNVYAEGSFKSGEKWEKLRLTMESAGDSRNAYLEIETDGNKVALEFISLFKEDTFKGRKNGFRKDIAEMIEGLHPKFMRFPGGCIVEGRSFENMYNWKDTIGPVETRRTNWNRWQMEEYQREGRSSEDYFQSYGIGFYEYFQFCEDIGAEPVPVINCGMTCQWHEALTVELDELDRFIQDAVDLIEFANGSSDTLWGKKRAEMGHEAPFGLKYLAIGNEQWGNEYFERYERFRKVLGEKHPEIKLITSAGWKNRGREFDLAYETMKKDPGMAYAVDEHFYKEPEWFLENIGRYDGYDRKLPKVLIGEYAAHTDTTVEKRRNNWYAALTEAAFLTGVEKNADHVVMSCYAPLLAKEGRQQWQPNLIWFDNLKVYGTPSYYVEKIFGEVLGEINVKCGTDDGDIKLSAAVKGEKLIIKAVNISGEEKTVRLCEKLGRCVLTELFAAPEAENSLDDPTAVYPTKEEREELDGFTMKPYSVMVIEEI